MKPFLFYGVLLGLTRAEAVRGCRDLVPVRKKVPTQVPPELVAGFRDPYEGRFATVH